MNNLDKVNSIFTALSVEVFYGLNFKLCMMELPESELKALESLIKKSEKERKKK